MLNKHNILKKHFPAGSIVVLFAVVLLLFATSVSATIIYPSDLRWSVNNRIGGGPSISDINPQGGNKFVETGLAGNTVPYTLNAYDIWVDTGIDLNNSWVTFSNAQTFSDVSGHENEWTWGIEWYSRPENGGIPYVWTDADGGYGPWKKVEDGIVTDAWFKSGNHGQLIGYIGLDNPMEHAGRYNDKTSTLTAPDQSDINFLDNVFGIGTSTVSRTGTGNVWIGFNDAFWNYDWGFPDNSGWVNVNIAVPEPATMLLLGLGLLGVAGIRSAGYSWNQEKV